MWKKLLIVALVLAAVLATVGFVVYARPWQKSVPVNWEIAGSVFNGIQVVPNPGAAAASFGMLNLSAKGSPGAARIEAVGTSLPVIPQDQCPAEAVLELKFDGGFVATFPDQSMLFFAIDKSDDAQNALCIIPPGPNVGVFDYLVTGGTGRFEGATGHVTVDVNAWGVSPALAAEAGTIVGTIELP